jgi:hypothetical protein
MSAVNPAVQFLSTCLEKPLEGGPWPQLGVHSMPYNCAPPILDSKSLGSTGEDTSATKPFPGVEKFADS